MTSTIWKYTGSMIIAESLLDKRDCTVAEVVTERPSQAPCLAPLISSICLLPRSEGLRPDFYCGHSFSSLFFLSSSFCPPPLPFPSFSAAFLGGFLFLPRSRSVLLSLRHSLLHRWESPTTSTGRHDYLWQLRGGGKGNNLLLQMPPRSYVSPDRERLAPL